MACIRPSYCNARQKFGSSISAGSFIELISQSNTVGSRKNEPVWRSRHVLDAIFFTRGHKLLSLIPSLPQLLFSVTAIFASFAGCFMFFEFQINKQHAYLLHVRKMKNVCFIWPILKQITECNFKKVWKSCAFTLIKFKYNQMMQVKETSFQKDFQT